jgi:hypothetical protein
MCFFNAHITSCKQAEKPAAQTAHLVFADTSANAEKTKRAVFCQRSNKNEKDENNYIH